MNTGSSFKAETQATAEIINAPHVNNIVCSLLNLFEIGWHGITASLSSAKKLLTTSFENLGALMRYIRGSLCWTCGVLHVSKQQNE